MVLFCILLTSVACTKLEHSYFIHVLLACYRSMSVLCSQTTTESEQSKTNPQQTISRYFIRKSQKQDSSCRLPNKNHVFSPLQEFTSSVPKYFCACTTFSVKTKLSPSTKHERILSFVMYLTENLGLLSVAVRCFLDLQETLFLKNLK